MLKLAATFSVVAAACLAADTEKQHKALASEPTPREWHAGAVWRFVTTPRAGKPQPEILTFRATDQPGVSCLGGWKGVWRKLIVVQGHLPFGTPTYEVEGRALHINLSGDMCDDYDIIDGVLAGGEFQGERRTFGLGAPGEIIGTVKGSSVKR
jgi:hypothetical protein